MVNFSKLGTTGNVCGYVDELYPWRIYDAWGDVIKPRQTMFGRLMNGR